MYVCGAAVEVLCASDMADYSAISDTACGGSSVEYYVSSWYYEGADVYAASTSAFTIYKLVDVTDTIDGQETSTGGGATW